MTRLSKPVATIETLKRLVTNSDSKYATKDSLSKVATTGNYSDLKGTPTSLKNPNAISFTGGSTVSYDGSKSVSVAIPTSLPANGGTATYATKLTVNAGSSTTPTYFYNGVPVACTGISVATVTATTTLNIPGGKIWIE